MAELRIDTWSSRFGNLWLQWREDGCWREVSRNQMHAESAGEFTPHEDEWAPWTGDSGIHGRQDGPEDRELTWCLLYGELPEAGSVHVLLPDGTPLVVQTIGRLWACEWRGLGQPVTVQTDDSRVLVKLPGYRDYFT